MVSRNKDKATRETRERARIYEARMQLHEERGRRRTRDNWIAAVVASVIVAGAIAGQAAYFTTGPGAPAPSVTPTVPAPSSSPDAPEEAPTEAPADEPAE